MDKEKEDMILTDRQGHPITDNQNIRMVGNRGPSTLENYHFIEKISHFDRERIPNQRDGQMTLVKLVIPFASSRIGNGMN